jgi:hypothetical protein
MSIKKERSRFVPVMPSLVPGLIVRLAPQQLGRPRGPTDQHMAQASPAGGAEGVDNREVRRQRLSLAQATRRGLRLVPRLDRLAWGGVWAVSVLVIVIHLLNSLAQPGSETVAPSVESFSRDSASTAALSVNLLEASPGDSTSVVRYALARWADTTGSWQFGPLNVQDSGQPGEEGVPFMLRIESAVPGTTYTFGISYDCAQSDGNRYDFLGSYDRDYGVAPALHEDGPGAAHPDATLAMPDDPRIPLDDGEQGQTFKLWGGSFASATAGPSPAGLCPTERGEQAEKMYTVALTAQAETMYLLWSGHLASGSEAGARKEAGSTRGRL